MRWEGMNCLVTGASSGFGLETAKELARRGASVTVAARREDRLQRLVAELGGEGHAYAVCDVSNLEDVRELAATVGERNGFIDVLVNNAGIPTSGPLIRASSEEMEKVIRTNLLGTIWCTKELLPLLESAPRTTRTPVVVNVASMGGRIPLPRSPDYIASKFGTVGFTESAWHELNAVGIKSMMVLPGLANTEGFPMDPILANPLTKWSVMGPDRVARALVNGIERGQFEVRVQWWLNPLYLATLALGPLRKYITGVVRERFEIEL